MPDRKPTIEEAERLERLAADIHALIPHVTQQEDYTLVDAARVVRRLAGRERRAVEFDTPLPLSDQTLDINRNVRVDW